MLPPPPLVISMSSTDFTVVPGIEQFLQIIATSGCDAIAQVLRAQEGAQA